MAENGWMVDGRLSIEHQISIHVNDLFDISTAKHRVNGVSNPPSDVQLRSDVTLLDVLAGLQYVIDYRLSGGRQKNLDADLMRKLVECLLIHMKHEEKLSLLRSASHTIEANMAFHIFGEFMNEGIESLPYGVTNC